MVYSLCTPDIEQKKILPKIKINNKEDKFVYELGRIIMTHI